MNALELADELERLYQQDIIDGVADLSMPEAATMLRQQQAEIEALKAHPVKALTDEEIDKLADEYLSDYFNMQETINFVRAIEERHGIK